MSRNCIHPSARCKNYVALATNRSYIEAIAWTTDRDTPLTVEYIFGTNRRRQGEEMFPRREKSRTRRLLAGRGLTQPTTFSPFFC
jgi:hypothetical protein